MSTAKEILYNKQAQEKIIAGVDALANAVKVTLGPMGRNVIIGLQRRDPHITKDGVTVARNVILKDPFENLGAQMVKEAAIRAAENAGDGTTTATVLTQAIIHAGLRFIGDGTNVTIFNEGIQKTVDEVIKVINSVTKECKTIEDMGRIAFISANGDSTVSDKIEEAFRLVGMSGTVMVQEGKSLEDKIVHTKGLSFDNGFLSPYFINNNSRGCYEATDTHVLLIEERVNFDMMTDIIESHEIVSRSRGRTGLVIIASDYDEAALSLLLRYNGKNSNAVMVKAPGFGERQFDEMVDIATVTGANVVSNKTGIDFDEKIDYSKAFGLIPHVVITKAKTVIEFECAEEIVQSRIANIQSVIEYTENEFLLGKLKERISRLAGGVATIVVGATTDLEMKERMDRYDDAIQATRAAVEGGYVAGGGTIYYWISQNAERLLTGLNDARADFRSGSSALVEALKVPLETIVKNAGYEKVSDVIEPDNVSSAFGYNARSCQTGDMVKMGVIDPAKVTVGSLKAAASVAGLILTTSCAMVELEGLPTIRA